MTISFSLDLKYSLHDLGTKLLTEALSGLVISNNYIKQLIMNEQLNPRR